MRIEVSPFGLHPNQFLQDFNVPYDPELPISYLFSLLSKERNWKTNSRTWRKNWNKCMACEYDRLIGYCNTNLETWQELCRQVGIEGSFMSITKCKKVCSCVLPRWNHRLTRPGPCRRPCQYHRRPRLLEHRRCSSPLCQCPPACGVHQEDQQDIQPSHCQTG